ncbi:conserved hypothetical protein [Burkholderia diffusa]|uniref:hypothetical protein n=1 Tax=Burkholderia diffusa TaxID=488732 RepID=UPI001CAD3D6F|nr:hypothetical protein [Burkholderia diffusa]CAG9260932.1 conserved hypothetical protein [Burkholderia diffusa]
MLERQYLDVVPAYHATANGRTVPFIVSILLRDANQRLVLPPAVISSINRTVEITGRCGIARAILGDHDDISALAVRYIERAMGIPSAIVLFLCQTPEIAEQLMQHLDVQYRLTLVREPTASSVERAPTVH